MPKNLKAVYEKASADSEFAKELLFGDPVKACQGAKIVLTRMDYRILGEAMKEIQLHFLEKLYIIAQDQKALGNVNCGLCWSDRAIKADTKTTS